MSTMASNPLLIPSGVHIPETKTAAFMNKFGNALKEYFDIVPYFGKSNKHRECEVKFKCKKDGSTGNIKKAKTFLKENIITVNNSVKKSERKKRKILFPQVIDLENENTPLRPVRTVDLTETDPETIVLDETFSELNKTLSELNSTIINISSIDLTQIKESYTPKSIINNNHDNDIEVLSFKINKKPFRSGSNYKTVPDSEVQIVESTLSLRRNNRSVDISNTIKPNLSKSNNNILNKYNGNRRGITSSERDSPSDAKINSKRKKRNSEHITSTPPRSLSGNALKYYTNIQKAVKAAKQRGKVSGGSRTEVSCLSNIITVCKGKRKESPRFGKEKYKKIPKHKTVIEQKPYMENNFFNPNPYDVDKEGFRPVVIDGSNIAVSHGRGRFSAKGIVICVEYFQSRGHNTIKVFLPQHRKDGFSTELLEYLNSKCDMVFTPSRCINGVQKTSYDDRFIVQYAVEFGGVIVSTDNYRDLLRENSRWRDTIHKRLLMFTWVDDFLMFPMDPLGEHGPTLDEFLTF